MAQSNTAKRSPAKENFAKMVQGVPRITARGVTALATALDKNSKHLEELNLRNASLASELAQQQSEAQQLANKLHTQEITLREAQAVEEGLREKLRVQEAETLALRRALQDFQAEAERLRRERDSYRGALCAINGKCEARVTARLRPVESKVPIATAMDASADSVRRWRGR